MATKIIAGLVSLAVSLGAGTALGSRIGSARIGDADPGPALAAALRAPVHRVSEPAWAGDRVRIHLVDGADIEELAGDYRVSVLGPSAGGLIGVPAGLDRESFIARIRDDLRVRAVERVPEDGAAGDGVVSL